MKARGSTLPLMLIGSLLLVSVSLFAHHGTFVSYDTKHPVTLTGVAAEYHFTNPHTQLYFDVTDDKGNVIRWAAEGPAPEIWVEAGWGKKRTETTLRRERKSRSHSLPRAMESPWALPPKSSWQMGNKWARRAQVSLRTNKRC